MKMYPMSFLGLVIVVLFHANLIDAKVYSPGGVALEGANRFFAYRAKDLNEKCKKKYNCRKVIFENNIEEFLEAFPEYELTFKFLEKAPEINGHRLAPGEIREINVDDECCSVIIKLHRGFAQLFDIAQGFIGRLLMRIFKGLEPLLHTRVFTFKLRVPDDCENVDVASLLATACEQAEAGAYRCQLRSPFNLEVSLAQPVEL